MSLSNTKGNGFTIFKMLSGYFGHGTRDNYLEGQSVCMYPDFFPIFKKHWLDSFKPGYIVYAYTPVVVPLQLLRFRIIP